MRREARQPSVLLLKTAHSTSNARSCGGVYDYAHHAGWQMTQVNVAPQHRAGPPSAGKRNIQRLKTLLDFWNPDGCIVLGDIAAEFRNPIHFRNLPVVYLDALPKQFGKGAHCVSCDNTMVASTAARELLPLDCGCYAYVSYPRRLDWCEERLATFRDIVRANGRMFDSARLPTAMAPKREHEHFSEWLSRLPKPCGIFAANDQVAHTVIGHCLAHGLSVPEDVAVIGVDDDESLCENSPAKISSVVPDFRRAGVTAASLLDRLMSSDAANAGNSTFPVSGVVRRQSTRLMKKYDVRVGKALEFIRTNAAHGISVTDVVKHMGCSRRNADLLFNRIMDRSILDEIHEVRIRLVKNALADPRRNLKVVAASCGYASAADMRRVFRRREGCTISEYAKRALPGKISFGATKGEER